jgi:hypothetical protein
MDDKGNRIDDLIHRINFPALTKQEHDIANVQNAGLVNKVTYIQAGELWFMTLSISLFALLVVFVYALLYYHTLYKKQGLYKVLFSQGTVNIAKMISDEDEEDEDDDDEMDIEQKWDSQRSVLECIVPMWSCVAYLVCMVLLSAHCLGRVLCSYEKELQERIWFTTMQIFCSALAWVTSTCVAFICTRCSKAHPLSTTRLSWTGQFLLYQLQRDGMWSLHFVTTVLLFDDILALVSVTSYDADSQDGTSLTYLLYIWLALFTLYILIFLALDVWLNHDVVILPYILMVIILCEIPARNHNAMSEDPAYLGTSLIGLLIIICLTTRLVFGWARIGAKGVPHFKSD